jgi:hypothetical protein
MKMEDIDRVRAIHGRAQQVKTQLKAQHQAAPDDFLREDQGVVPSHSQAREMAGKPGWSRRSGLFTTKVLGIRKRPHRGGTGRAPGRPTGSGDTGLAQAVEALMASRGIDEGAAIKEIARLLAEAERITKAEQITMFDAVRKRIYRALGR